MSNTTRSFPVLASLLQGRVPAIRPHVLPHRVPVILRVVSSIFGNTSRLWACYRLLRLPFAPGPGSEFVFPFSYGGHQGPASDPDRDIVRLRNDEDDAKTARTVSQWIDLGEYYGVQMITLYEDYKRPSKPGACSIESAAVGMLNNIQRRRLHSGWSLDPEDQGYGLQTSEGRDAAFEAVIKELCHNPELEIYKEMAQHTFAIEPLKPEEYVGPVYSEVSDALADGWLLETEDGMTTWHHPQHWDQLDARFQVDGSERPLTLPAILTHGRYETDIGATQNGWSPQQDFGGYFWTHARVGNCRFDERYRTERPHLLPAALRSIPGCLPVDHTYSEEQRLRDQPNTPD